MKNTTAEQLRLNLANSGHENWRSWGPYVSERQWGTVREDYSPYGNAWEYFPHDHARSRAYRWGEDGIAGFSDDRQQLCLSLALWNGRDPILKERLFGLTNSEGNHGEDVKEVYYYLDATPSHSYLKILYKYLQAEYPYARLVQENRSRGADQPEFELLDTGLFDEDRYFDVFVEYAKAAPDDILMLVTVHNRGPEPAKLSVLPQLCFRNTWTWKPNEPKPKLIAGRDNSGGDWKADISDMLVEEIVDSLEVMKNLRLRMSLRFVFPTGGQAPFGSDQWQVAPGADFTYRLPDTLRGISIAPFFRYFNGFDAGSGGSFVQLLHLYPAMTVGLDKFGC